MSRGFERTRRATTLVEAIIFGAVASLVVVGLIGLLSKGSKIVELGRRTSSAGSDLKVLLEVLSEDAAELVYLENDGKPYLGTGKLSFVVRSTRAESGVAASPTGSTGLRRIEYRLDGTKKLKDVMRTVTPLGATAPVGSPSEHRLVTEGIASLKVWPVAAVPAGGKYELTFADKAPAKEQGATVACLVVEVVAGEAVSDKPLDIENSTVAKVVTKLWCRNRLLELSRGSLR